MEATESRAGYTATEGRAASASAGGKVDFVGLEYDDEDLSYDMDDNVVNDCNLPFIPNMKSSSQHNVSHRFNHESEAEDGYHTSREYEFVLPTFSIGDDTGIDGIPNTPLKSNSSQVRSIRLDRSRGGVKIDPMMQQLLGVEFLPFDERLTGSGIPNSDSYLSIPTFSEDSNVSFGSSLEAYDGGDSYAYDDDSSLLEDDIDDGNQITPNGRGKRNRRKRGFGLRRGFNPKKENRKNQRLVKRMIAKDRRQQHRNMFQGVSQNIDTQMSQIDEGRKKLRSIHTNLRQVKNENKRIVIETQRSSTRINKLGKTVTELECQLDMAMKSLEKEKVRLASNMEAVAKLDRIRSALENKARGVEQKLSQRLGYIEQYQNQPSGNGVGGAIETRSRLNTGTDISFMTADEPPPSPLSSNDDLCGLDDISLEIPTQKKRKGRRGKQKTPPTEKGPYLDNVDIRVENVEQPSVVSPASANDVTVVTTPKQDAEKIKRKSNFLRIHDLGLPTNENGTLRISDLDRTEEPIVSTRMDLYSLDCDGRNMVLNALAKRALTVVTDEGPMWVPDRSTEKIISSRGPSEQEWHYASGGDVFVWSGKLDFEGFGDDILAVKARAIIPTTAENMLNLLMDSSRVKEYNKMSLGRTDQFFFKKGVDSTEDGLKGEAKVFRSLSSIPLIKKQIELRAMMYAKTFDEEIHGSKGYLAVTRSVWEDEASAPTKDKKGDSGGNADFIRSEMLLSVNCIRDISASKPGSCELTTVTHFHTPGMPTFGAKTMGMKAAANFIKDVQAICSS